MLALLLACTDPAPAIRKAPSAADSAWTDTGGAIDSPVTGSDGSTGTGGDSRPADTGTGGDSVSDSVAVTDSGDSAETDSGDSGPVDPCGSPWGYLEIGDVPPNLTAPGIVQIEIVGTGAVCSVTSSAWWAEGDFSTSSGCGSPADLPHEMGGETGWICIGFALAGEESALIDIVTSAGTWSVSASQDADHNVFLTE